jgi:hypothetical protein
MFRKEKEFDVTGLFTEETNFSRCTAASASSAKRPKQKAPHVPEKHRFMGKGRMQVIVRTMRDVEPFFN